MVRYYLSRRLRRRDDADEIGIYRIPRYELVEELYERETLSRWIAPAVAIGLALALLFIIFSRPAVSEEVPPADNDNSLQTISVSTPVRVAADEGARVIRELPLGLRVQPLAKYPVNRRGETWMKVRIETSSGARTGWINQRDVR